MLVDDNDTLKISDFGTSRHWMNQQSTKMSFCGTVAWMAPEVIKADPCSDKVDVWSYGVVLWELLTCEIPYKDVDSSAVMWGVGSNSLQLPVPESAPEGLKLLLKQCWSWKPRHRPSFRHIMLHLDIANAEMQDETEEGWLCRQEEWRREIGNCMETMRGAEAANLFPKGTVGTVMPRV